VSDLLVLSEQDVYRLLPMRECIAVMADALASLAEGAAYQPLRSVMRLPDGSGFLGLMPGQILKHDGKPAGLGLKAVAVFPGNAARGIDTHQGGVLLLDGETGRLVAVMDGAAVTAIRTAAVSGVATDRLARKDAGEVAILGAGVQAHTHLEAVAAVRPIRRVRIWSRTAQRARNLVAEESHRYGFPIEAVDTAEAAARDADIIVTVTASPDPILQAGWVKPGAHINAVGSSLPSARELDTACVVCSRLFVDRRESALAEAGDLLIPMKEGAITPAHIVAELGDVIIGRHPGRKSPDEVTLFKSLGLAVEDVAAAAYVVGQAHTTGAGTTVSM
jgi:ornithine cyclodeaminase